MAAGFKGTARSIVSEKLGAQLQAYYKPLHALMVRYLRNHHDAEDVVQAVNERVVRYLDRGGSVNRLSYFMYRTAHNLAIDKLRERARSIIDRISDCISDQGEPDVPHDVLRNEPHEAVEADDMVRHLYRELPPPHKDLLEYGIEGLTVEEIAAITGYTRTTIETYKKRLRSACRAAWKGE